MTSAGFFGALRAKCFKLLQSLNSGVQLALWFSTISIRLPLEKKVSTDYKSVDGFSFGKSFWMLSMRDVRSSSIELVKDPLVHYVSWNSAFQCENLFSKKENYEFLSATYEIQ